MSSNQSYQVEIAVVVMLGVWLLCGCCRKQYTQQTHLAVSELSTHEIDTYLFKGVKHYVYDTTVIVVNQIGDTIREDHSSNTISLVETEEKRDTVIIVNRDTIQSDSQVVVKNELNKAQKFFFWIGVIVMITVVGVVIYKLFKLFRV